MKNLTNLPKKFCEFPPWFDKHKVFLNVKGKKKTKQCFYNNIITET